MNSLNHRAVWMFFVQYSVGTLTTIGLLGFIGFLVGIAEGLRNPQMGQFLLLVCGISLILILMLCYLWAYLSFRCYKYEVTHSTLSICQGVILRRKYTIPLADIHNVTISQHVLSRLFQLVEVQLDITIPNPESNSPFWSEGYLPGLDLSTAEELANQLAAKPTLLQPGA